MNQKYKDLENALKKALESVQSFGALAEENVYKLSNEQIAAIPAEFAQDVAKRIRNAAQMEHITTLNAMAAEIKTH